MIVIAVLVAAAAVRAATMSVAAPSVERTAAASVTLTGTRPTPAWPSQGQAAVEVEGMQPLGSSGPATPVPIASLAKVMTAYVILKDHPLTPGHPGFTYTVTAADVAQYRSDLAQAESVVPVVTGESLTEMQLLEALLVPSGNNVATILANYDSGSVAAFVTKMNTTAHRLGMDKTTYTDASGVESTTVSTASDQLVLAAHAMADPVFARIVAMPSVNLPVAGVMTNFNQAVGTGGYVGVKTGSDALAGGCLVFANRQVVGGRTVTLLGVVLGQDRGQQATSLLTGAATTAANALVQSVTSALSVRTVLPAGSQVAVVTNASGQRVAARTGSVLSVVGFGGLQVPIRVQVSPVGRHVTSGETVAEVSAGTDPAGTTPARVAAEVPGVSFGWKLLHIF